MHTRTLGAVTLLLLFAAPAFADQILISADGKLIQQGEVSWLRVGSYQYPLQFGRGEVQDFAATLHNKNVHVEGTLDTIPQGRAGAGQVYIRAETLVLNDGSDGGHYGVSRGRGYNYTDTIVVPRRQTGPIPSRPYPRY